MIDECSVGNNVGETVLDMRAGSANRAVFGHDGTRQDRCYRIKESTISNGIAMP